MTSVHLSEQDFELYVLDMLDVIDKAHVERHVTVCARCAAALAAEARAELRLQAAVAALKPQAARGAKPFDAPVPARHHEPGHGEQRWTGAVRTAMSAATLIVLVWSLGSVRLDTRYVPRRLPQEPRLSSTFSRASEEPAPSCEVETEELLCRVAVTGAATAELDPGSDAESRLVNSCAQPTMDVCRSEGPAL